MTTERIVDMERGVYRKVYSGFVWGERISSVSMEAEAWFWRLHAIADDFGNLPGGKNRVATEAGGQREVDPDLAEAWTEELIRARLVARYCDGKHLHIVGFETNQPAGKNGRRIRRYPMHPPDADTKDAPPTPAGESGGIRVNPAESKAIRPNPAESGQVRQDPANLVPPMPMPMPMPTPTPTTSPDPEAAAAMFADDPERKAVAEYLTRAEVNAKTIRKLVLRGLTLADAKRVNESRNGKGRPPDGVFISQLWAVVEATAERERKRAAAKDGAA